MSSNTIRNLLLVCGLAILILPYSANAQTAVTSNSLSSPAYDLNKEIKIQGTIEKIQSSANGGPAGAHLLVSTAQGMIDVHLGASAAVSAKNLGLTTGENIDVTGMMATMGGNSVMLARILTTSNHIYMLRNEHGAPVRSLMPRAAAASSSSQKGAL
ncbi:MAG: hypothetical protein ACRD59_17615 [Candidatus Acidiferrales bacterium]